MINRSQIQAMDLCFWIFFVGRRPLSVPFLIFWVEVPLDGVPGGDPPLADQEHPHAEEQDEDTRQVGVEQYLAILQEFLIPGI